MIETLMGIPTKAGGDPGDGPTPDYLGVKFSTINAASTLGLVGLHGLSANANVAMYGRPASNSYRGSVQIHKLNGDVHVQSGQIYDSTWTSGTSSTTGAYYAGIGVLSRDGKVVAFSPHTRTRPILIYRDNGSGSFIKDGSVLVDSGLPGSNQQTSTYMCSNYDGSIIFNAAISAGNISQGSVSVLEKVNGTWSVSQVISGDNVSGFNLGLGLKCNSRGDKLALAFANDQSGKLRPGVRIYHRIDGVFTLVHEQFFEPQTPFAVRIFSMELSNDFESLIYTNPSSQGGNGAIHVTKWNGVEYIETVEIPNPNASNGVSLSLVNHCHINGDAIFLRDNNNAAKLHYFRLAEDSNWEKKWTYDLVRNDQVAIATNFNRIAVIGYSSGVYDYLK